MSNSADNTNSTNYMLTCMGSNSPKAKIAEVETQADKSPLKSVKPVPAKPELAMGNVLTECLIRKDDPKLIPGSA